MFTIAIHGGAGTILPSQLTAEKETLYRSGLEAAIRAGEVHLKSGGTALDAVCAAVACLEDNPLFNAGKGSVFNHMGRHEMDASVMCGHDLSAGAVTCVTGIRNPVNLARLVMEKTEHVMLCGAGAEELAHQYKLPFETPEYFFDSFRHEQWLALKGTSGTQLDHAGDKKFGTVGAVALDLHGNVAAATSTGGMTNKKYNRIGDTPVIGSGTYASNNSCAISCTGHGEYFLRAVVAHDISCLMEYKGYSLEEACRTVVIDKLLPMGGEGGVIGVDTKGNISLIFNSEGMYRASLKEGGLVNTAIYKS